MVRFLLLSRTLHPVLILPFTGFSAASQGAYPTGVNLIIPETVGHHFTVLAANEKLTHLVDI